MHPVCLYVVGMGHQIRLRIAETFMPKSLLVSAACVAAMALSLAAQQDDKDAKKCGAHEQ